MVALLHIGMNMFVLLDIAPVVEEVYGSARFLFLYTACGIGGSLCSTFFGSNPSVGASGAILGLLGLLLAITTKRSGAHIQAMRSRLISWVVTIFAFGFLVPGIDRMGPLRWICNRLRSWEILCGSLPAAGQERTRAYLLGWLAFAVIAAAFALMFMHLHDPLPMEN